MTSTYEYKRYMRDGSVKIMTGIVRSKTKKETKDGTKEDIKEYASRSSR